MKNKKIQINNAVSERGEKIKSKSPPAVSNTAFCVKAVKELNSSDKLIAYQPKN
jgi:hypothetical protein